MMSRIVGHEVVVGRDEPAQGAHGGAVAVELVDRQAIVRVGVAKLCHALVIGNGDQCHL